MTQWHLKGSRRPSGGLRATTRRSDKRLAWKGGEAAHTTIAQEPDRRILDGLGGTSKVKLRADNAVYVMEGGKARKLEILTVVENDADRQFARNNIITRGAVLKAKDGASEVFVKVTNRPGQQGTIQGLKLDKFVREKDLKAESGDKKAKKKKAARKHEKKSKEAPKEENK